MKPSILLGLFCAVAASSLLEAQSGPEETHRVSLSRAGVRVICPAGWNVLNESARETIVGNYVRSPDTPQNVFGGPGKAYLSFQTLPIYYKDLAEWIFAGRRLAPEAIERKLSIRTKAGANEPVTRLGSPPGGRHAYASYFFQVGSTPVLLELNYNSGDPHVEEYESAVLGMIEGAQTVK